MPGKSGDLKMDLFVYAFIQGIAILHLRTSEGLWILRLKSIPMKSVLLVDDDHVFNFLSQKVLEQIGEVNDVHTAVNGKEALGLFNEYYSRGRHLPDIILLDLNMPIMDGFAFLEAFRKLKLPDKERVRIIVVTSSENPRDIARVKNLGVDQYLIKPLNQQNLIAALES